MGFNADLTELASCDDCSFGRQKDIEHILCDKHFESVKAAAYEEGKEAGYDEGYEAAREKYEEKETGTTHAAG